MCLRKNAHQKNSQHHAVENRTDDVDGLDEIFRKAGEQRERDSYDSPEGREPFGGTYISRFIVRSQRAEMSP